MFPLEFLGMLFIAVISDNEEKNKKQHEELAKYDISIFKKGDLLEVSRTLFTHFGIYLGDNRVAHLIPDILPVFTSDRKALQKMVTNNRLILGVIAKQASVRVDSVEDFAFGAEILVNHMDKVCSRAPLAGDEVARRAEKLLGPVTYSLLWYNCEHYVMYCRYGTNMSFQTYQFCKTVRKIVLCKRSCLLTLILFLFIMFYMQCVSIFGIILATIVPFIMWMSS